MPDTDIDKLRELAEAATPGPWAAEPNTGAGRVWVQRAPTHRGKDCEPLFNIRDLGTRRNEDERRAAYAQRVSDAAFIAACSPDVILPLVAELVGLRTEADQLRTDEDEYWRTVLWLAKMRELSARFAGAKADEALGLLAERDAARAEVATLTEVRHADAAERDALQAQLSEMTTYRNDWQRRAQQAEQDRNDEHDYLAALQARIDRALWLLNEAEAGLHHKDARGEPRNIIETVRTALGVDPQKDRKPE